MDYQYFEQVVRSDEEAKFLIDFRKKVGLHGEKRIRKYETAKDATDEITVGNCAFLILSLLLTISRMQTKVQPSSDPLCYKILPFATELLNTLNCDSGASNLETKLVIKMKVILVEIILLLSADLQKTDMGNAEDDFAGIRACFATLGYCVGNCNIQDSSRYLFQMSATLLHVLTTSRLNAILRRSEQESISSSIQSVFAAIPKAVRTGKKCEDGIFLLYSELVFSLNWASRSWSGNPTFFSAVKALSDVVQYTIKDGNNDVQRLKVCNGAAVVAEVIKILSKLKRVEVDAKTRFFTWNLFLLVMKNSFGLCEEFELELMQDIIEKHIAHEEDKLVENPHDDGTQIMSDSDSAFYPSDGSIEKCKDHVVPKLAPLSTQFELNNILLSYLELCRSDNPVVVKATIAHVLRLSRRNNSFNFGFQIFTKVLVPLVDDKACLNSLNDVDLFVVKNIFCNIPSILTERDALSYFHNRKILKSVVAFKSVPDLVQPTYHVINAYLTAEISFVLDCTVLDRVTVAVGASSGNSSEVLTEEEAFQPEMMKALSLTTIVKEFHEILMTCTAGMLNPDVKEEARTKLLEELECVWKTERNLIQRFPEYFDYAQSKGIARIIEDLLNVLLSKLSMDVIAVHYQNIFATVGYLLDILIRQEKAKLSHDDSLSSMPSSYFDESKIIDNCLQQLLQAGFQIRTNPSALRALVRVILNVDTMAKDKKSRHTAASSLPSLQKTANADYDADEEDNDAVAATDKPLKEEGQLAPLKMIKAAINFCSGLAKTSNPHCVEIVNYTMYSLRQHLLQDGSDRLESISEAGILRDLISLIHLLMSAGFCAKEAGILFATIADYRTTRSEFRDLLEIFKSDGEYDHTHLLQMLLKVCKSQSSSLEPRFHSNIDQLIFALPCRSSQLFGSQKSFSFSLWLTLQSCVQDAAEILVLTLGDRAIEIDVRIKEAVVVVTLKTFVEESKVQGVARFDISKISCKLPWNHLVVTCANKNAKGWEIGVFCNGNVVRKNAFISLKTPFGFESTRETFLSFGSGRSDDIRLQLASVMAFQGISINQSMAILLYLLGPEEQDLSLPINDLQARTSKKEALLAYPDLGFKICRNSIFSSNLSVLMESLWLKFSSRNPEQLQLREEETSSSSAFLVFSQTVKTRTLSPSLIKATHAQVKTRERFKLSHLVMQEGGAPTLVLVLARLVEKQATDREMRLRWRSFSLRFCPIHK